MASTLAIIRPYVCAGQLDVMQGDPEYDGLALLLASAILGLPTTGRTDGQGDAADVWLHYFVGGCDWWITEKDIDGGVDQAFGLAKIHETELGYISIRELVENGVEVDLHWRTRPLSDVRAGLVVHDGTVSLSA